MKKPNYRLLRSQIKKAVVNYTMCAIQHNGWPCNCCFHTIDLPLKHDIHEYWLAVLALRGDYPELPQRIDLIKELLKAL